MRHLKRECLGDGASTTCWQVSAVVVVVAAIWLTYNATNTQKAREALDAQTIKQDFYVPMFGDGELSLAETKQSITSVAEPLRYAQQMQRSQNLSEFYQQHRRGDFVAMYTAQKALWECNMLLASFYAEQNDDERRAVALQTALARCGELRQVSPDHFTEDVAALAASANAQDLGARVLSASGSLKSEAEHLSLAVEVIQNGDPYLLELAEPLLSSFWHRIRGASEPARSTAGRDAVMAGYRLALCDLGLPCAKDDWSVIYSCVKGLCANSREELIRHELPETYHASATAWHKRFTQALIARDHRALGLP